MRIVISLHERKNLLTGIGAAVRALRQQQNLTVRAFAAQSKLSPRFINQLEAGTGNISIAKLASVAQALGCTLPEILPPPERDQTLRARVWRALHDAADADWQAVWQVLEQRRTDLPAHQFIALIGLRGAGKSTIGQLLAEKLKTEFVELDHWVEQAAGMPLAEIFNLHGESYYRRLEHEALQQLLLSKSGCVFAPGGSIVTSPESWDLIKRQCFSVWLHATPQEFMKRMLQAGETRLTQPPSVMNDLKALLMRRESFYAQSTYTVKTSGKKPAAIVAQITKALTADVRH